jgi:hypothetical protein
VKLDSTVMTKQADGAKGTTTTEEKKDTKKAKGTEEKDVVSAKDAKPVKVTKEEK